MTDTDMAYPFYPVEDVISADEAREIAIDWQNWASDAAMSYAESAMWLAYFEQLAAKFPELEEEFRENGII